MACDLINIDIFQEELNSDFYEQIIEGKSEKEIFNNYTDIIKNIFSKTKNRYSNLLKNKNDLVSCFLTSFNELLELIEIDHKEDSIDYNKYTKLLNSLKEEVLNYLNNKISKYKNTEKIKEDVIHTYPKNDTISIVNKNYLSLSFEYDNIYKEKFLLRSKELILNSVIINKENGEIDISSTDKKLKKLLLDLIGLINDGYTITFDIDENNIAKTINNIRSAIIQKYLQDPDDEYTDIKIFEALQKKSEETKNDVYTDLYIRYIQIAHFDDFIYDAFKGIINVNFFGDYNSSETKYILIDKSSNVKTNHDEEGVDIEKLIASIPRMIVETTPFLTEKGKKIKGRYLSYLNLLSLYIDMSRICYNARCKFYENPEENTPKKIKGYESNFKFGEDENLHNLLCNILLSPSLSIPRLFEFFLAYGNSPQKSYFKKLSPFNRDVFMSFYKKILDPKEYYSFYNIFKRSSNNKFTTKYYADTAYLFSSIAQRDIVSVTTNDCVKNENRKNKTLSNTLLGYIQDNQRTLTGKKDDLVYANDEHTIVKGIKYNLSNNDAPIIINDSVGSGKNSDKRIKTITELFDEFKKLLKPDGEYHESFINRQESVFDLFEKYLKKNEKNKELELFKLIREDIYTTLIEGDIETPNFQYYYFEDITSAKSRFEDLIDIIYSIKYRSIATNIYKEINKDKGANNKFSLRQSGSSNDNLLYNEYSGTFEIIHGKLKSMVDYISKALLFTEGMTSPSVNIGDDFKLMNTCTGFNYLSKWIYATERNMKEWDNDKTNTSKLFLKRYLKGVYHMREFYDYEKHTDVILFHDLSPKDIFISQFANCFLSKFKITENKSKIDDFYILPAILSDKHEMPVLHISSENFQDIIVDKGENIKNLDDYISELKIEYFNWKSKEYKRIHDKIEEDLCKVFNNGKSTSDIYSFINELFVFDKSKNPDEDIKYFIYKKLYEYNSNPLNDKIILSQNIHYVFDKNGSIKKNELFNINYTQYTNELEKQPGGIDYKYNKLFAKSLNNIGLIRHSENDYILDVDISKNSLFSRIIDILKKYDGGNLWIDSNGNIIAYKINTDSSIELYTLNPLLEFYNYLYKLASELYVTYTAGMFEFDSNKENELDAFSTSIKRFNQIGSSTHSFQTNELRTPSNIANVAILEDYTKQTYTLGYGSAESGSVDSVMYMNPFFAFQLKDSLGGNKLGNIIKPLFRHYMTEYDAGLQLKCAGYTLLNEVMRNESHMDNLLRKMTDREWKDNNGNNYGFYNEDAKKLFNNAFEKISNYYYKDKDKDKYYRVNKIWIENGKICKKIIETDITGSEIGKEHTISETVNTNYKLWKFFGGENSMILENGKLVYSDTSIELVALASNNLGIITDGSDVAISQENFYQPLKHSDIHLVPYASTAKKNIPNSNPISIITNDNSLDQLLSFEMDLSESGIQLEKEHDLDGGEEAANQLTQAIKACSITSDTVESKRLYDAIKSVIESKLSEYEGNENTEESKEKSKSDIIYNTIKLIRSDGDTDITATLIKYMRDNNKDLSSNSSLYDLLIEYIAVELNNNNLKYKTPGLVCISAPGVFYNIFEERDTNETWTSGEIYSSNVNSLSNYIKLNREYDITYIDNDDVDEFGNAKIKTKTNVLIDVNKYYEIKKRLANFKKISIRPSNKQYRGIDEYNIHITSKEGNLKFQAFDIDSVLAYHEFMQIINSKLNETNKIEEINYLLDWYGYQQKTIEYETNIDPITNENNIEYVNYKNFNECSEDIKKYLMKRKQFDFNLLCKNIPTVEELFNQAFPNITKENIYEKITDKEKFILIYNALMENGNGNKLNIDGYTYEVDSITDSNIWDIFLKVKGILHEASTIKINNQKINLKDYDVNTIAAECVLSKLDKTAYNLPHDAKIKDITNDKEYFVKLYDLMYSTNNIENTKYTISLKNGNGKHVYILYGKIPESLDLKEDKSIKLLKTLKHTYRLSNDGSILNEVYEGDKYYRYNGLLILYVNDKEHLRKYIDNLDYDGIYINKEFIKDLKKEEKTNTQDDIVLSINSSSKIKLLLSSVNQNNNTNNENIEINNGFTDIRSINSKFEISYESNEGKRLYDTSSFIYKRLIQKHTSFLLSLQILAGRIPGQSIQSFMPLKVAEFFENDTNRIYLSQLLLLLEGIDFDIDTVTLMKYNVGDNGIIQLHSPYINYDNIDVLENTMAIRFPTGLKVEFNSNKDSNINEELKKKIILFHSTIIESKKKISTRDDVELFNYLLDHINEYKNELKVDGKIINSVVDYIDYHNTYLLSFSSDVVLKILVNYQLYTMRNIASNPSNLLLSSAPLDDTTGYMKRVAKDNATKSGGLKLYNPFDPVSLGFINADFLDKKTVAIYAAAARVLSILHQSYSNVLNNGTEEELKNLLFKNKDLKINGSKVLPVGVRPININTVKDMEVLKVLASLKTSKHEAILDDSSFISLSVDNAKNLALTDLNATSFFANVWTAGTTCGYSFDDINTMMQEDSIKKLKKLQLISAINGEGIIRNIQDALNYLFMYDKESNTPPYIWVNMFSNYNKNARDQVATLLGITTSEKTFDETSGKTSNKKYSLYKGIKSYIVDENGALVNSTVRDNVIKKLLKFLSYCELFSTLYNDMFGDSFVDKDKYSANMNKIISLYNSKNIDSELKSIYKDSKDGKEQKEIEAKRKHIKESIEKILPLYNKLTDDLKDKINKSLSKDTIPILKRIINYYNQINNIFEDGEINGDTYNKVIDLLKLSDTFKLLSTITGLNQGIKVLAADLLNLFEDFQPDITEKEYEECVYKMYKSIGKDEYSNTKMTYDEFMYLGDLFEPVLLQGANLHKVTKLEALAHMYNNGGVNKKSVNKFDIILHSLDLLAQVKVLSKYVSIINNIAKRKIVEHIYKDISRKNDLGKSKKFIRNATKSYINDRIICKYLSDSKLTLTIKKGSLYYDNEGKILTSSDNRVIEFNGDNIKDNIPTIKNFIHLMNEKILEEKISKRAESRNLFISDLAKKESKNPLISEMLYNIQSSVLSNTPVAKQYTDWLSTSLNDLYDTIEELNIDINNDGKTRHLNFKEALFIYNLLAFHGNNDFSSFTAYTKYFVDAALNNRLGNPFIKKYFDTIDKFEMDSKGKEASEIFPNYEPKDIYTYMAINVKDIKSGYRPFVIYNNELYIHNRFCDKFKIDETEEDGIKYSKFESSTAGKDLKEAQLAGNLQNVEKNKNCPS